MLTGLTSLVKNKLAWGRVLIAVLTCLSLTLAICSVTFFGTSAGVVLFCTTFLGITVRKSSYRIAALLASIIVCVWGVVTMAVSGNSLLSCTLLMAMLDIHSALINLVVPQHSQTPAASP